MGKVSYEEFPSRTTEDRQSALPKTGTRVLIPRAYHGLQITIMLNLATSPLLSRLFVGALLSVVRLCDTDR